MSENYYSSDYKDFTAVPDDIEAKVEPLWEKFQEARDSGQFEQAEKFAKAAWQELPEPKLGWDYYANVIPFELVEFYRNLGKFDDAEHWLELARQSYGPGHNASVEFVAATLAFEKADLDAAFEEFDRLYTHFGKRPFVGAADKYLEFTLERRGK